MASPKVEKRYSKPAKVVTKKAGDAPASEKAAPGPAAGAAPDAAVVSGTDGIPVSERQATERTAMMERQTTELKDMHKRHLSDMSSMSERHMAELGPGGDKAADKKD